MLKLIIEFYNMGLSALSKDIDTEKIVSLPVREKIGRFKYVPENETDEKYKQIKAEIGEELKKLSERGE